MYADSGDSLSDALLPSAQPRTPPKRVRFGRVGTLAVSVIAAVLGLCVLLTIHDDGDRLPVTVRTHLKTAAQRDDGGHGDHDVLEDTRQHDEHEVAHEPLQGKRPAAALSREIAEHHGIIGDAVTHSELTNTRSGRSTPEPTAEPLLVSLLKDEWTSPSQSPSPVPKPFTRKVKDKQRNRVTRKRSQSKRKPEPRITSLEMPTVELFPVDAAVHNESFITRSDHFDRSVPRDKGIIISLHDGLLAMGLSLIKELRCLDNHELIQVYHCLPADLSLVNKQLLVSQDNRLEIIDVCGDLMNAKAFTASQAKQFKNWWVKPLAIHHTNLKEPILLDADDINLYNPAVLRDSAGYKENGTMFFYDRVMLRDKFMNAHLQDTNHTHLLHLIVDKMNYSAFGLAGPKPSHHLLNSFSYRGKSAHEMDSSMVAIDKTRPGKAMDVLWWVITKLRHTKPQFTFGDKESFWLSYELAQQPYAFSPWGVAVVESHPNRDMIDHPDTLCGSLAHYIPSNNSEPQLLYIDGKAMLDPHAQGIKNHNAKPNLYYNDDVKYVVPRMPRTANKASTKQKATAFAPECLVGLGSTPIPSFFQELLLRRRIHYMAVVSGLLEPLEVCEYAWSHPH